MATGKRNERAINMMARNVNEARSGANVGGATPKAAAISQRLKDMVRRPKPTPGSEGGRVAPKPAPAQGGTPPMKKLPAPAQGGTPPMKKLPAPAQGGTPPMKKLPAPMPKPAQRKPQPAPTPGVRKPAPRPPVQKQPAPRPGVVKPQPMPNRGRPMKTMPMPKPGKKRP